MTILFLSETDPREGRSGTEQRTRFLYEAVKQFGTVYALAHRVSDLRDPTIRCKRHQRLGILKRLVNHLVWAFYEWLAPSLPKYLPFGWGLNESEAFPGVKFDLVVARYLHEVAIVHAWKIAPLLVDIDDHPLQVLETVDCQRLGRVRRFLAERIGRFVVNRLVRRTAGCWIANGEQVNELEQTRQIMALPNIPQLPRTGYRAACSREMALMTVGLLSYVPNREGVTRFLREIWPTVRRAYPTLSYWVVGRGISEEVAATWRAIDGVKLFGFVEDLDGLYEKVVGTVVPVDAGGGTCIKTLESLSHSRVCLSTPFGVRGLPAADLAEGANGLFVYEDAATFVSLVGRLLAEKERAGLEVRAKDYADQMFSRERFEKSVKKLICATGAIL